MMGYKVKKRSVPDLDYADVDLAPEYRRILQKQREEDAEYNEIVPGRKYLTAAVRAGEEEPRLDELYAGLDEDVGDELVDVDEESLWEEALENHALFEGYES